jgi:ribosomal peptide maturation radical SAM protein 1
MTTQADMADICLVSMPYAAVQRPPLALGLLKAVLDRDGIRVQVAPASLWFAEKVGLRLYRQSSPRLPAVYLAGEWTFAKAAFRDACGSDEDYLTWIKADDDKYGYRSGDGLVSDLRLLRDAASDFIDEAASRVLNTGARVVGCTSTFEQHVSSLALLRRIHELDPEVVTMLGGANCETVMGQATHRSFPWVDYVVSGEADGLITKLCRLALTHGRDALPDDLPSGVLGPCHRLPGMSGRDGRTTVSRAMFRDLDSLPVPHYGEYFGELAKSPLRGNIRPGLPLETSRGCWWGARHQCTFCGLNGSSMIFHSKSPDRVLDEIHELEDQHGISSFEIVDNILDMNYFSTLLPRLAAEPQRRTFFYEVKANLSRRHIETLVNAGVTYVQPGIESLHSEVLRIMDKGIRGWQNVQLLKWARELGVLVAWFMLWGFPGEVDDYYQQMAQWLPLLEHLQPPGALARLRYDRYSVYYDRAEQMGLELLPVPAMSHVYPLPLADLGKLTYFFIAGPKTTLAGAVPGTSSTDLSRRPGLQAVRDGIQHWRAAFHADLRPILSMQDRDGKLSIIDSRDCATTQHRMLTGVIRAVCLACDAAPRSDKIAERVRTDFGLDASDGAVEEACQQLIADGLVLPIDDRLVGLALQGTLPPVPDYYNFPGGSVNEFSPDS